VGGSFCLQGTALPNPFALQPVPSSSYFSGSRIGPAAVNRHAWFIMPSSRSVFSKTLLFGLRRDGNPGIARPVTLPKQGRPVGRGCGKLARLARRAARDFFLFGRVPVVPPGSCRDRARDRSASSSSRQGPAPASRPEKMSVYPHLTERASSFRRFGYVTGARASASPRLRSFFRLAVPARGVQLVPAPRSALNPCLPQLPVPRNGSAPPATPNTL